MGNHTDFFSREVTFYLNVPLFDDKKPFQLGHQIANSCPGPAIIHGQIAGIVPRQNQSQEKIIHTQLPAEISQKFQPKLNEGKKAGEASAFFLWLRNWLWSLRGGVPGVR